MRRGRECAGLKIPEKLEKRGSERGALLAGPPGNWPARHGITRVCG